MTAKVEAIEAGCAECGTYGEPLITRMEFDTVEAAKAHYADDGWLKSGPEPRSVTWSPHPQGGEHVVVSQGSVWIRG